MWIGENHRMSILIVKRSDLNGSTWIHDVYIYILL